MSKDPDKLHLENSQKRFADPGELTQALMYVLHEEKDLVRRAASAVVMACLHLKGNGHHDAAAALLLCTETFVKESPLINVPEQRQNS